MAKVIEGSGDERAPRLWRIALPAFGPTALSSIGTGATLPVITFTARELGASVSMAALCVALIGVGSLLGALPAGWLVARLGERRALVIAGAVQSATMLVAFGSTALWQFVGAILVLGIADSMFHLARHAYITEAVPLRVRARALSTLGGIHRIGLFLGPVVGAAAIASGSLSNAYLVGAAGGVASIILILSTSDITAHLEQRRAQGRPERVMTVIVQHRRTLLTLGTGALAVTAARAARVGLVPLWAEHIGLSAAQTSLIFAIAAAADMMLFYPAGAIMDHFGRVWTAVPAALVLGVGIMTLPLTGSLGSLTLVATVLAIGNGLGSGIVMTMGSDASPAQSRAQFLAGWRLVANSGALIGPMLVSALAAIGSLAVASVVMGALTVAGAGWLARWVPGADPRRKL